MKSRGLLAAIEEHASDGKEGRSEAMGVIDRFRRLTASEQQNLLNFLRSL